MTKSIEYLEREYVPDHEAVIDGDGKKPSVGRETTRTTLLVIFRELHRRFEIFMGNKQEQSSNEVLFSLLQI